jgi:3-dehydroshikimate dehydratase
MLILGLVSVTFRQLTPQEIIALVAEAQLNVIEWGGDIHVPHGDTKQAETVARWTKDTGLSVAAYGSYYRLATPDQTPFERVVATAVALGAPTIRVWAGTKSSADADETYRQQVYAEAYQIADIAQQHSISVSFEFHDGTLTDTADSALALMEAAQHPNLAMYWQPPHRISHEKRRESLETLLPYVTNVHVFQWHPNHPQPQVRYPLADGAADWQPYLESLRTSGRNHALMIEFVRDDNPDNFREDAKTLLNWLADDNHPDPA